MALLYAFRVIFIIIVTWDMGIYGNQEWEMGELEKLSTPLCRRPFYGLLLIYYLFLYFYIFFFFTFYSFIFDSTAREITGMVWVFFFFFFFLL